MALIDNKSHLRITVYRFSVFFDLWQFFVAATIDDITEREHGCAKPITGGAL
ncbi:MAG: hypothetical protein WBD42_05710 [Methylovirgula sp.]